MQSKTPVQIWLYEQSNIRIEGRIVGFDEYMNLVLVEACERHMKSGAKKMIGKISNFIFTLYFRSYFVKGRDHHSYSKASSVIHFTLCIVQICIKLVVIMYQIVFYVCNSGVS